MWIWRLAAVPACESTQGTEVSVDDRYVISLIGDSVNVWDDWVIGIPKSRNAQNRGWVSR
jgi:hypothetical protein